MKYIVFIFFVNITYAQQFPSDLWHPGLLVTNQGDSIKGNLKYDFENQSIQLDDGETLKAFNVNNLFFFEIYDETIKDHRQFYSLMYEVGYEYSIPVLFEMVINGKLSLLLRERIVSESTQSSFPSYYAYSMMPRFSNNIGYVNKIKYDYFFLDNEGNIIKFKGKKKELYNLMNDQYQKVKSYISNNKINLKRMRDLARGGSFYNQI